MAKSFYAPELDGLRFIAALLVFFNHAPPLDGRFFEILHLYGWIGVDLFLCISVFLLTVLLNLEWAETGTIHVGKFFVRRILRIWPLYFSYTAVMCAYAGFYLAMDPGLVSAWWLSFVSFSNNLLTALKGYSPIPGTPHLWTISLEEQAYCVIPFLILAFHRGGARRRDLQVFFGGGIALLIMARFSLYLADAPHPFVWVLPVRADSFLAGALAAFCIDHRPGKYSLAVFGAGVLIMASTVLAPPISTHSLAQVFGYTTIAIGCGIVVFFCRTAAPINRFLALPTMRYFGKISYGIYVYQFVGIGLVLEASKWWGFEDHRAIFAMSLILTLGLSACSYAFLERPFLSLKGKFQFVASRPL
jgi:peptidoglycan/LPS O-acetylase OafA/YrhL